MDKIDINNVVLKSNRLILRSWKKSDLNDLFEYAKVKDVGEMAGWLPHKTKKDSKEILNDFMEKKEVFAIEYNCKVIGSLGIHQIREGVEIAPDKKAFEIGYALSKTYWNLGLMSEALKTVMKYLFGEIKVDLLMANHFITNKRSKRVLEKAGFKFQNDFIYTTYYGEKKQSKAYMLTKEDYYKNRSNVII